MAKFLDQLCQSREFVMLDVEEQPVETLVHGDMSDILFVSIELRVFNAILLDAPRA